MTSNISSATNPLGFSDGHEVLERPMAGVPALRIEEALRLDLPGSHAVNYELPGNFRKPQTVAQEP